VAAHIGKTNSTLAGETLKWIARRCDVAHLEKYIAHPEAMPLLALPWWLEKSIRGEVDVEFQSTLMASSVHGYFFIRMLDDLMDGHQVEPASLPALHLFSFRFHSSYFRFFPASDPFWTHFERNLASTAEAVSSDHALKEISAKDFLEITSRKSSAALIPVAAVCCRYGREDLLPAWEQFLSLFARWHQMRDDVLDWSEDYEASHATWILGEAQHRKAPEETTAIWMGRTGLHWAAGVMDGWMAQIKASAAGLGSPELVRYLDAREAAFSRQMKANLRLAALCESLLKL
jgi:hypothetical protein